MEDKRKSDHGRKLSPAWKGSTLIIFFLILYMLYHIFFGISESVQTTVAGIVKENSHLALSGVVFRNEKGILNKSDGNIYPHLFNGERVENGGIIGEVCDDASLDLYKKVNALKQELDILERSNDKSLFTILDIQTTEKEIDEHYSSISKAIAIGDINKVKELEKLLLIALNKLEIYKGNVKSYDSQISVVKKELDLLYSTLNSKREYVYADIGGYVYYQCDGYEDEFANIDLTTISFDSIKNIVDCVRKNPTKNSNYSCKIVYDYTWYICTPCDKTTAALLKEGKSYLVTLYGSNSIEIDIKLEKIIEDNNSNAVLVFSCGIMPKNFDYLRYQEFKLDILSVEGYRVPKESVCVYEDENGIITYGVYILEGGIARFRKIEIMAEGNGYYIASKIDAFSEKYKEYLHLNDRIILNIEGMYDGKILIK